MAHPYISIIVGNRNYGQYLRQCLLSVLAQTTDDYELIVVDDASDDNSRDVLASLRDPRLHTVLRAERGGQAVVFNAGFEYARGELVAFLDSDDWWKPDKLEEVLRWHRFFRGEYGLLQHNVEVWEDGRVYPFKPAMCSGDLFADMQRTKRLDYFVGSSGLVAQTFILKQIFPLPTDLRICADAYITRTAFTFGPVVSIPRSLAYYRKHRNAVMGNRLFDNRDFNRRILFPALDAFYRSRGISFQFSGPGWTRSEKADTPTPCLVPDKLLRAFVRERWRELGAQYPRMAVFGAGQHSRWLERVTKDIPGPDIVSVLDDRERGESFWGLSPQLPARWTSSQADAILLSSDCHQVGMGTRCVEHFGADIPCVDLYEGLPPGPYEKT